MFGKKKSVVALILALSLLLGMCSLPVSALETRSVIEEGDVVTISTQNYTVKVQKNGFRYGFYQPDGTVIADMHGESGICFGETGGEVYKAASAVYTGLSGDAARFEITNTNGDVADVAIHLFDTYVKYEIIPRSVTAGTKYTIDARVEGIDPLYGLGDHGTVRDSGSVGYSRTTTNVHGVNRVDANSFTNYLPVRFITNFTIAPQRRFAQVLFHNADKRVSLLDDQTMLGVLSAESVKTLYYFFGEMETIYSDYRKVRNEEGYIDSKPHYEMFGLGWEAYGALGWNADQKNVLETVQAYLDSGYDITWAVIGSGFWPGDRKGKEGSTTSFGMWDDTYQEGRTDGLANPRFPDPAATKQFFIDKDIKLLLGLRPWFRLPPELGGSNDVKFDGDFVLEGLEKDFFLKNDDGSYLTYENNVIVDGGNPEAVEWYTGLAELWGVDGFKEDAMFAANTHHDDNWNKIYGNMVEQSDSLMIVRNGAYSLNGDILRIEDHNYGLNNDGNMVFAPDRKPINLLNFAASGASNVYPDIIGGTGGKIGDEKFQMYTVRSAQLAALCPSISVGINVLNMDNDEREEAAFKAINWHSTYVPYIYDAALKSYETGYPTSFTPLYIAYPDDENTYDMASFEKRQYEWLLGESILATPAVRRRLPHRRQPRRLSARG